MATILVNQDLCTRCGICSVVCPMSIVDLADEDSFPSVQDRNAGNCIGCGHCEVLCPSGALLLNIRPDEKVETHPDAGILSSVDLSVYLKKRRSIRHFTDKPVPRKKILQILDIARYAPSGGNAQPVQWLVIHDPGDVKKIAGLTIEWMKTLQNTNHPLSEYSSVLIRAWENDQDVICRDAPHLLFAHIPEDNPGAFTDAIIALTHFDIAAPAFGVGACWAGFVSMGAMYYEPLQKELDVPSGRKCAYALMFGHPRYRIYGLPRRNPVQVVWK